MQRTCSAYVSGIGLLKGGGDCDDGRPAVFPGKDFGDPDSDGDGLDDGIEFVMGSPLHDDDGGAGTNPLYEGIAARFSDNMFGDFVVKAAEAQDYNSSRSNKPSSRARMIGDGATVMDEYSKELAAIFKGESSGDRFTESYAKQMSGYGNEGKLAQEVSSNFVRSLQALYKKEQEALKSADKSQSDRIYERAARKSGLGIDALKDIVTYVSASAQKKLAQGGSVEMIGFGTFSISKRSARTGRNPQTGKEIKIAAAPSVVTIRKRPGRTKYSNITLKK